MWRIVLADWRRLLLIQLGGWTMGFLVVILIAQSLGRECCLDDVERRPFLLKMFLFAVTYGQSSAVLWAQINGTNIYHRQKLLATLPLSQRQLNLVHYLTAALFLAGGVPVWLVVMHVWHSLGVPFEFWLASSSLLATGSFLLLSMRNLFPRVLIPFIFPFLIVPGLEWWLRLPLEIMTTPFASLVLGIVTALFGWWVLDRPTPHWAPGWGGRSRRKPN
jgi:hypothetical protein